MRPKTTGKKLPPRMVQRVRKLASGKLWIGYYYNGRDDAGKRKEISLGTDLNEAKRQWAVMECAPVPTDATLMQFVFERYIRDILPNKGADTQRENNGSLRQLRAVFDTAPIDAITPQDIARYRDARTAKVRANREISLFSHVFNMAREWGFTTRENPCRGVRKNKEKPRTYYADEVVWDAVYEVSSAELRDAMDLNYLTGQRPADVLKMTEHHVRQGELHVHQGKTQRILRIRLVNDGHQSDLDKCIIRLLANPVPCRTGHLIRTDKGDKLSLKMLRDRFNAARTAASVKAAAAGNDELAKHILAFQFRDIRPKAASEIDSLDDASRLLGHSDKEITKKVYRRVGERVKPTR